MPKLINPNREQFCIAYTNVGADTFGNGTRAYMQAYPKTNSENSAAVLAHKLLKIQAVKKRLSELHHENMERNDVTIDSVLANISHDRQKARESGHWSVAAQLDKLEGQYLSMFTVDNHKDPNDGIEPLSEEETALFKAQAKALTKVLTGPRLAKGAG